MGYREHKKEAPQSVSCAVITISSTRTEENDESGRLFIKALKENGLQVIITSGGTGISHLDITVETIAPILEKRLDGFGELFRFLTYQEIGTASIMSRAFGGVARGKVILCLPGSSSAARLALDKVILPELGHLVREATR